MSFLAPSRLFLLLAVYGLAFAYLFLQLRRRNRYAVRFTNLALLESVAPKRPGWRRHVPAVLLLLSLSAMVISLARPSRDERVPRERATIIMAIDVSISMNATDVAPNRLEAAKDAATSFVEDLPPSINLGLVAFAGTTQVLVSPTTDRAAVERAVSGLQLREATAIGDAIVASLDSIKTVPGDPDAVDGEEAEVPPAHIVLMSDGETTVGIENEVATQAATEAGVPVSTIAFGTQFGTIEYEGEIVAVPTNPAALEAIADSTGGSFFEAVTGDELQRVYADIGSSLGYENEPREIALWFVGAAYVLGMLAGVGSLVWFSRLP